MEGSNDSRNLNSLVEKLRQEQEFSSFYRGQIQQAVRDINRCCDQVFQSLWLSQCLGHLLDKTKLRLLQPCEWTAALERAGYVLFVDAAKILRSSSLIESYKRFLGGLLERPAAVARVLVWAESEGRDSASLISDLLSVVYGHCVFRHDHALFLQLLRELLGHLVSAAESPRELFSGVEPVFCRVLTEYSNQHPDLQTFVAEAFQSPLSEILTYEDYLEFDVSKAGSRIQSSSENTGTGRYLDGSAFLFGEDLDFSCDRLAKLAAQFVDGIFCFSIHFPPSLKWVLASLKTLVREKWPEISPVELRRPVSSLLFGPILGSTIVNPDSHGVCSMDMVVGPIARYNLSQVASVLQGCAWVMQRRGGKFPMQKVIRKMNTESYCALLDTLDSGYGPEAPHFPSSLPGLKRTSFLASQTQLNHMVGLVYEVAKDLSRKSDTSHPPVIEELKRLTKGMPTPMKQMATSSAYFLPTLAPFISSRSPTKHQSQRSSEIQEPVTPGSGGEGGGGGGKGGGKKKDPGKASGRSGRKPRSSSTSNLNQILITAAGAGAGGGGGGGTRSSTRSISPNKMMNTHGAEPPSFLPPSSRSRGRNLEVPAEVLILPISKSSGRSHRGRGGEGEGGDEWDFAVLSQDEFMQQQPSSKSSPFISPTHNPTSSAHHPNDSTQCTPTPAQDTPSADHTPQSHHTNSAQDTPSADPTPQLHHTNSTQDTPSADHTPQLHHTNPAQDTPTPEPLTSDSIDTKSESQSSISDPVSHSSVPIPPVPVPRGPSPISESSPGYQNGIRSGSNSTNSVCSPVREPWARHSRESRSSGTGMRQQTHSTGSDSSLSTCMSSREPSTSPQTLPKKRSFTITSIDNGKFQLNFDLQRSSNNRNPLSSPPPPISPSSPVPIITTTPTPLSPPSITSPLANGLIHPSLGKTAALEHSLSNGSARAKSPNRAHPTPSQLTERDADSCTPVAQQNHELSPSNIDLSTSDHDRASSGHDTPTTMGSSVENLLEGGLKPGKENKKKRWFKRKKIKPKHLKQQVSLQEERPAAADDIVMKQQRSKSHDVAFDGAAAEEGGKRQSLQRGSGGPDSVDAGDNTPRMNTLKKRRSNTIIEKYRAIVDEQKKKEVPRVVKEKLDSLPRFVHVKVGEMSEEEFRESLFCTQLEYKLRAALQNVHTPLTSDLSGGVRGSEVARPDLKWKVEEELTSLLELGLQRSRWVHDNMESALISETLDMVSQLPNPLVGVAVWTAHEEHARRRAYSDYLIQSHMRFLDVRLQVGAVQTTVDRYQEVLREQFVQFAVREFMEGRQSQLADLRHCLVSLPLADERCSLMVERVEGLTEGLMEQQTWRDWPRENNEMVSSYLEDQLFSLLYLPVFQPNMELDRQRDEVYSAHLLRLSEGLTPTHPSLQISPIYHSGCPWLSAQRHLEAMALLKSPRGKVHCIAESCRVLISLLQYAKVGSPPGADDLFPVLVYIIIMANPPALLSTTQFIKNFLEDQLVGEENYWWVQFSTAVEFTKTLE